MNVPKKEFPLLNLLSVLPNLPADLIVNVKVKPLAGAMVGGANAFQTIRKKENCLRTAYELILRLKLFLKFMAIFLNNCL